MPGIELIGEHASLRAELDRRFSDPGELVIVLHPARRRARRRRGGVPARREPARARLGDPGEARERAVAAQDATALYRLGLFHEGREEPAEAEAAYRGALELGHADAACRLGGLLSGAAAQDIYERAAELGSWRAAAKVDF